MWPENVPSVGTSSSPWSENASKNTNMIQKYIRDTGWGGSYFTSLPFHTFAVLVASRQTFYVKKIESSTFLMVVYKFVSLGVFFKILFKT